MFALKSIDMKKFLIYIFFLLSLTKLVNGQPSHGKNEYVNFIRSFYHHLLNDNTVTVKESTKLFEASSVEYEAYLFNLICVNNPDNKVCKERGINSVANSWGNYSSIFFEELKNSMNRFTFGYIEQIDSIILNCSKIYDECSRGLIALDINFPNGKTIYFYLNRYPDESIYITDIYFEDGSSFYCLYDKFIINPENKVDSISKRLVRLGIINDVDRFTNVRKGKGKSSPVTAQIVNGELFYFTPDYYNSWWEIKNKNGTIEGYMHKSRIVPYGALSSEKKKSLITK